LLSTVQEVVPFGNGFVMVWGGISIDDKSDLVVIRNGALNARRYIDEMRQTQIPPRAHAGGENFVLITLLELENALLEEWRQILQENIRRLIRSMPRRCAALIQARGGPTKY
jgi:hypothetical protein